MSRRRSSTAPSRFGSGSSVNQRKFPVVDRDGADNITDAIGQRELDRLLKKGKVIELFFCHELS